MRPTPRRAKRAKSCLTGCAVQFTGTDTDTDHGGDQLVVILDADRVHTVRSRLHERLHPSDRLIGHRRCVRGMQEQVGSAVYPDRYSRCISCGAQTGHEVGMLLGAADPPALRVHGVLDIESDPARIQQTLDQLARIQTVTGLQIDRHRHINRGNDGPNSRNHLGKGLSLVVLGTAGLRKWMTADRQRRKLPINRCPC